MGLVSAFSLSSKAITHLHRPDYATRQDVFETCLAVSTKFYSIIFIQLWEIDYNA